MSSLHFNYKKGDITMRLFFTCFYALLSLTLFSGCQNQSTPEVTLGEHTLRLSITDDPQTLDPRKARDIHTNTLCPLLFEGLTRLDTNGNAIPAVAETIEVSEDGKSYIFYLRESYWSNGDPVTAFDFEYTWKEILSPNFPASNANQLYVIKNAKKMKEGTLTDDDIGINAIDDHTLTVELEHPTPYFLKLCSFRTFMPINHNVAKRTPHWAFKPEDGNFACNGPFKLVNWHHHDKLVMKKNEYYWDAKAVKLAGVTFVMVPPETAVLMFDQDELDWIGSPLDILPNEVIASRRRDGSLQAKPAAATQWLRFNCEAAPFNNPKLRQAFSYAINRAAICEHLLQGNQQPAMGLIPPMAGWTAGKHFEDNNIQLARELLQEGLTELGITKEELPPITISYSNAPRGHQLAQAIQDDWRKALEIEVQLEAIELKVFWDKLAQHNFQIASGNWFADVSDPVDFLNVFKYLDNGTNNTQWEDPVYTQLLDMSQSVTDPAKRQQILRMAEELIIGEAPVAPIFYFSLNYVKNDKVKNVYVSDLGSLDLKHAEIQQ